MLLSSLVLLNALTFQAPQPVAGPKASAKASAPKTYLLVVAGISGEAQYERDFTEAGKRIVDAARTKYSIPDSLVTFLVEHPERDSLKANGQSTKAEIEKVFGKIAATAKPDDLVFVVLIGHGSSQGSTESAFNLVGPDMTAADFAKLLAPLSKQQVAFVNAASASGDFLGTLAGKNRVIVTATMSPMERNYAKFIKHFSAAYAGTEADLNKDGRVSLLEAFNYAHAKIEREYKSARLLQSEHSMLEDNGDGKGSGEPEVAVAATDGRLADRFSLSGVTPENPRLTALFAERDAILEKLTALRARQASMNAEAYGRELEGMIVDLVVVSLKVRQVWIGGKS